MAEDPRVALRDCDGASQVLKEILQDEGKGEWWTPKSDMHTIFEQARMKFVNGNLNYLDLRNMVVHAQDKDPYWNPAFTRTREVCSGLKWDLQEKGPLGRMCVWCIPAGSRIEPHTDNYDYHRMISRWILFLNQSQETTQVIFDGVLQPADRGNLLRLQPFYQKHYFVNNSNAPWYFFAFDTWDPHKLRKLIREDDTAYAKDPKRVVYQSKH